MVTNDPISDMLARIKNAYMAHNADVEIPWSKMKENLAKILVDNGYIVDTKVKDNLIIVTLKYNQKDPAITQIKRVSKPSLRVYAGKNEMPKVLGGGGIAVISTPKGLMTNKQAKKLGIGGEIICEIY